jgi:hypothetical protein
MPPPWKCFFITMIHLVCIVCHVPAFVFQIKSNNVGLSYPNSCQVLNQYSFPPRRRESTLYMARKNNKLDHNINEGAEGIQETHAPAQPHTRRRLRIKRKLATIMLAITAGITGRLTPFKVSNGPYIPTASANVQFNPLLGRELEKMQVKSNAMLSGKVTPYQIASRIRTEREAARMEDYNKRLEEARKLGNEEAFEEQYKAELEEEMKLEDTRRRAFYLQLLAMGINPSGIEGQKHVWKFEYDIDLTSIKGTDQERVIRMRGTPGGDAFEARAKKLEIIELESLMDDNVDLVEFYILKNSYLNGQEMGAALNSELVFDDRLPRSKLLRDISKMEYKFRQEGKAKTTPRRDYDAMFDEVDLDEVIKLRDEKTKLEPEKQKTPDKAMEKEMKRLQKLKEQEEKNRIKAEKKAESDRLKMEKAKERERLQIQKIAQKEAAKKFAAEKEAAKRLAADAKEEAAQKAALISASAVLPAVPNIEAEASSEESILHSDVEEETSLDNSSEIISTSDSDEQSDGITIAKSVGGSTSAMVTKSLPSINTISKASGAIALVGGSLYSLNLYSKKEAEKKAEQQRKFDLIMGNDKATSNNAVKVNGDSNTPATTRSTFDDLELLISGKDEVTTKQDSSSTTIVNPPPPTDSAVAGTPKKKRSMLGSIFKKESSNGREVSLERVLSNEIYPQTASYSQILSQYLTVGAPGRFPELESKGKLQNVMDEKGEFQLETAKENLIQTKIELGINDEEAAESFANVVNAMIIQLVDLASSATEVGKTPEEKEKLTVDALNVVLDYMDHAASLFDAVAQVRMIVHF